MTLTPDHGAFVISLDLECYWGVKDYLVENELYLENLAGERDAIASILELFVEFKISASWATVGFLFAETISELEKYKPANLPEYDDPAMSPYSCDFDEIKGKEEFCFTPDLIELIAGTPGQEIATHTFSHFYCREKGQSREAFDADVASSIAIAAKFGIDLKSIVFPRNQHNPDYDDVLLKHGITCYRGNQPSWMYQFDGKTQVNPIYRGARLADTYFNLSGMNTITWNSVFDGKLANIPASMFLRPVSNDKGILVRKQLSRIKRGLEFAARNNQIFHLWWHPHNFGRNLEENIGFLRQVLEYFQKLEKEVGIKSLTMADTAAYMVSR